MTEYRWKKNRVKSANSLVRRKIKSYEIKVIAVGALFFILAASLFYLFVFSPVFKLNNINVAGTLELDQEILASGVRQFFGEKIYDKIPIDNVIFLPREEIINSLLTDFPRIAAASLEIKLVENTLLLNIKEREPAAIWCRVRPESLTPAVTFAAVPLVIENVDAVLKKTEKCFFVDNEGFIFADAPILSGGALLTVYDQAPNDLQIKDNVSNPKTLKFIIEAKNALAEADLNLTDFIVESQSLGELEILAPDGWRIYLNLDNPVFLQVNALKRVLEEEIKEKRFLLEYVDLRVQNKAYYKLKTP